MVVFMVVFTHPIIIITQVVRGTVTVCVLTISSRSVSRSSSVSDEWDSVGRELSSVQLGSCIFQMLRS